MGAPTPGKESPEGEEQELWGVGLILTTQEMADLEHMRVALHFFSNAAQNPLPPGRRPSGGCPRAEQVVPSQETRKLESGNAIINPQTAGGGSPGLHQAWQEKQTALELCGSPVSPGL